MATIEIWKPVLGYTGFYDVSDMGRVRSLDREVIQLGRWGSIICRRLRGKVLAPGSDPDGYLMVNLSFQNRQIMHKVHHLVLEAFVGERPLGLEACHNDGQPANNRLDNLRWDTPVRNNADKLAHGTHIRGEEQGSAKLTGNDVLAIRASSMSGRQIAKVYGVSETQISLIRNRKQWRWL